MGGNDEGLQADRIAKVARSLQDHQEDQAETYQLAVQVMRANVTGCDDVGFSLVRRRKRVETVASIGDMALAADQLQYELGEGPCLDAIWEHRTVYSPHLAHDSRWPTWGPRTVEETDARSVLSFRIFTHGDTLGALNLYSRSEDAYDGDAQEEGLAIAAHVAIAVAAAQEIDQLKHGLDSRTIIGQATGILMGRYHLDADAAFKVLARYSSAGNVPLRDIAAEVVRTRGLPSQPEPKVNTPEDRHGDA